MHREAYWTPPSATFGLRRHVSFPGTIWEPACGAGWLSDVLSLTGCEVVSSDLYHYGYSEQETMMDFLREKPWWKFDHIITNPPYSESISWVKRAWDFQPETIAMLLQLDSLSGIINLGLPIRLVLIPNRTKTKYGHANGRRPYCMKWHSAWVVIDKAWKGGWWKGITI